MTTALNTVRNNVEDAPTVDRTQRRGSTLHVYMKDGTVGEYEVETIEDGIRVTEIDTVAGGKIGSVDFNNPKAAGAYIKSV